MQLKYRPEIDGLRSLAVISVIIYHAQIYVGDKFFLTGGYLGVDIFFVISGYLISRIIISELENNRFSFSNFYERRIRRIIPALLVVILFTSILSWIYLHPSNLTDYSNTVLSVLIFSSNIFFYFSDFGYGTFESMSKPLLHTWSLGIEEQFYIFFPIFFVFFKKYIKFDLKNVLLILIFSNLILIQFLGNLNFTKPYLDDHFQFMAPSIFSDFYLPTSRIWELLIGSYISICEKRIVEIKIKKFYSNIITLVGLLLCILPMFYFDNKTFHPSFLTLIPIFGIFLIIFFSNKKNFVTKILSNYIFVKIGLLSYSLYLWHYPLFTFARIYYLDLNLFNKIIIIIVSFILSYLTYSFIEKPFRNKKYKFSKILIIIILQVAILLFFCLKVISNKGYPERFDKIKSTFKEFQIDNDILRKQSWDLIKNKKKSSFADDNINILFIGDSHSKDMFNVFYQNKNLFNKYTFNREELIFWKETADFDQQLNRLKKFKNFYFADYLIVSNRFQKNDLENLKKLILFSKNYKKKMIILSKSTEFRSSQSSYTLYDKYVIKNFNKKNHKINLKDFKNNLEKIYFKNKISFDDLNKQIYNITIKENVKFLNKEELLCNNINNTCLAITPNGEKIFYDYGHYTIAGAKYIGELIYNKNWLKLD